MKEDIKKDLIDTASHYYLQPLSLLWRINHVIPYLIGGICFFIGSVYYLPIIVNYDTASILFTIGSTTFLYADINEWWKNNRVGCMLDKHYRTSYENQVACNMESQDTILGRYQRTENGLNYGFSAFGSFLYLIGSILEIPALNTSTSGTIALILGSLTIVISQTWKIYRAGCKNDLNAKDIEFQYINLFSHKVALCVDVNAGLGGFAYFVGCILYLPSIADSAQGVIWFILGGLFFTISGLFLAYRYFGTLDYPH